MFGAMMFVSKLLLEGLPNFHIIGMFTVSLTIVYRYKALVPVYVFVFLTGLYNGFALWWYPYLYIWAVLWGAAMLVPRGMQRNKARIVYLLVCALHGLLYGTLYAPFQAIAFNYSFTQTIAWIGAGLPWDAVHCAGNAAVGCLILPLSELIEKLKRTYEK